MPISFDLTGRRALVTGANSGIGKTIATSLAEAGADIALLGRTPPDETLAAIRRAGRLGIDIKLDISMTVGISGAVNQAANALGGLDILVNNAGVMIPNNIDQITEEDWDTVVDTNLKSLFFLSQAAAACMASQRAGKIINIASILSFQGGQRVASYTASKSGVAGLTRAFANEVGPQGIQVNAVAPAWVPTRNTAAIEHDEKRYAEVLARIPAGRWGRAEDVAGAVIYFASSASDFVNGQVLAVDGGWLAR